MFSGSGKESKISSKATSEAFDDSDSPPQSPKTLLSQAAIKARSSIATLDRPFYELIVDGIHSHPNSVRLAYNAHPEGCILITDGAYPG
jgi:N-acetylglucosamine-6-phosphate deacetylase